MLPSDQNIAPDALRPRVDAHAHAFTSACTLEKNRRYTPANEAPIDDYVALLNRHEIAHGVLIQPSFLGTDNSYVVESIARFPDRLRGVAVLTPDVSDRQLNDLDTSGICGLRYNLVGDDPGKLATDDWRSLTRRATTLGWHIEVHIDGTELEPVLDTLIKDNARIVFDHFGRPVPTDRLNDSGFRRLLGDAAKLPVWVKLSAPYRFTDDNGQAYAEALLENLGPSHVLWGSDWPWTRFEEGRDYATCISWLADWFRHDEAAIADMNAASLDLFGFKSSRYHEVTTDVA